MRRGMAGGDLGCEALSCWAQLWSWSSWSLPAPTHAPALAIAPPHPCSAPVPPPLLLPSRPPSEDCRGPAGGKSTEVRGFFCLLPLPPAYQHTCARAEVGLRQPGPSITQASCLQGAQEGHRGSSLVVQCVRIRLPVQGTQVRSLVWEGPTRREAGEPVVHTSCQLRFHSKRRDEQPAHLTGKQHPLATTRDEPVHSHKAPARTDIRQINEHRYIRFVCK